VYTDGAIVDGKPTASHRDESDFDVSVELLAPSTPGAAARVLVFDGSGKRVFEGAVAAEPATR